MWKTYYEGLIELENNNKLRLPVIPKGATNNAHMFYVVTKDVEQRDSFIKFLKNNKIHAVFHYLSLHKSSFHTKNLQEIQYLPNADLYTDCLVRLPLFYDLDIKTVDFIIDKIKHFFNENIAHNH